MKRSIGIAMATFLLIAGHLCAQTKGLSVGDKVPSTQIDKIINYKNISADIFDYKGKLVLIDFFATTCGSCVEALPKIDSLQRLFGDKMQVFTVTNYEKEDAVWTNLKRNKYLKNLKLPVVVGGQNLKKLFPYQIISHVAWIGSDGIVKAITGTDYVTASNIQKVLNGENIDWPVKQDVFEFDYSKPLFVKRDKVNITKGIYASVFTGCIEGVDGKDWLLTDSAAGTITRNHFNSTLLKFIDYSLNGQGTGDIDVNRPKHLIFRVNDPGRYVPKDKYSTEWTKQNTYTYSYTLPFNLSGEEIRNFVKRDLTNWLDVIGIKAWKEKSKQKVWVLKRISHDDRLLITKGKESDRNLEEDGRKLKQLINERFSSLVDHLNMNVPGIPWVFDETKIPNDMMVDMVLKIYSFRNLPELRNALKKYGLDIEETEREMDMYVVREKDYKEKK